MHDDDDDDGDRGDSTVVVTVTVMVLVEMVMLTLTVMMFEVLEWFLIECCKTKTKVIILANHSRHKQCNEPDQNLKQVLVNNAKHRKMCESKSQYYWFGFASHWLRK